jgi:galactosylceramidase
MNTKISTLLLILSLARGIAIAAPGVTPVTLDGKSSGRVFEGLGALSAGASSRLLMDYPEPQRSQILDFLFQTNFGASLQHLKVEIGGDTQSTDGTEPSIARTREEFENPKPEYFQRGYEWFLMKEARKRNPGIPLDVLQWGAPGWIGDQLEFSLRQNGIDGQALDAKKFFSQDNADFIAAFIKGAKQYHDLDIQYCGLWNERRHDPLWIKVLRKTLDRAGLTGVKIIAADGSSGFEWNIVKDILDDDSLKPAIHGIGVHYPVYKSPEAAKSLGLPLWSSEDGFWEKTSDPWQAARIIAKQYNRNYAQGRMTKTIVWSLITCYFDNLPLPGSGLMLANQPWSGHYEVPAPIWVTAHTTQFARPGWHYVDSGCGLMREGGSAVTLRDDAGNFSMIIETIDATQPQTLDVSLNNGLAASTLHVWRTTEKEHFIQLPDITVTNNHYSITAEPEAIYSLTTTTGQKKGSFDNVPPAAPFPLPFKDDFENRKPGSAPRYFTDQAGVFEIAPRSGGTGQCLRQVVPARTIEWMPMQWPMTLIGSDNWTNYEVSCDVRPGRGHVTRILARANRRMQDQGSGYVLSAGLDGFWSLYSMPEGTMLGGAGISFAPNSWHNLKLRCLGPQITVLVDGKQVLQTLDICHETGSAGLGTGGWYEADFDNFEIKPITEPAPVLTNLALGAQVSASSEQGLDFDAGKAIDGNPGTYWAADAKHLTNQWIEVNFGKKVRFNSVVVRQDRAHAIRYGVIAHNGTQWVALTERVRRKESNWGDTFKPVESDRVRLVILMVTRTGDDMDVPTVREIGVYDTTSPVSSQ